MLVALFIYILLHSDWLLGSRVTVYVVTSVISVATAVVSVATAVVSVATADVSVATADVFVVTGQRSVEGHIYVMFHDQCVYLTIRTLTAPYQPLTMLGV